MSEQKEDPKRLRKVLIGTPAYDGKVDVSYVLSLAKTLASTPAGVSIATCFVSRQSILQMARNEIIEQAVQGGFDDLIFIDSDMAWEPKWVFSLLARKEQVVGGTARRKDDAEGYAFLVRDKNTIALSESGLVLVDALGTGFLRIGREALLSVWSKSAPYKFNGREARAVCEVGLFGGRMLTEDYMLCAKLDKVGYQIWLDPSMTCAHVGAKVYSGDALGFINRLCETAKPPKPPPDSPAL